MTRTLRWPDPRRRKRAYIEPERHLCREYKLPRRISQSWFNLCDGHNLSGGFSRSRFDLCYDQVTSSPLSPAPL
jgi:hypothetical protein